VDDLPLEPDVQDRLRRWESPAVTPTQTAHLIETLSPLLPQAVPRRNVLARLASWSPLLVLWSQVRVVRGEIWIVSALVMAIGTGVTLAVYQPDALYTLPLIWLAPLVAAGAVALLYDSDLEAVLDLEDSTPTPVRLLLLARLTLVFGFNLSLGFLGSVVLAVLYTDFNLWSLVLAWLAPMTFLSGLAFFVSVLTGDSVAGALTSMGLWQIHLLLHLFDTSPLASLLSLPGLAAPENRPLLIASALLLAAVGLLLAGRAEHRSGDYA
jgi:hypothetical protein